MLKLKNTTNKVDSDRKILDTSIKLFENMLVNYSILEYKPEDIPENYFDTLMEVANDGFWIQMSLEDVKNHILRAEQVFILKINNQIVWFSSLKELNDFIYRFWTVIKKDYQAHWLYKILSKTILDKKKFYFLRTQNQNVIKSLQKEFKNVLYWEKALQFILSKWINIDSINSFMLFCGDKGKTLWKNGIFKGVYGWKMWEEHRVKYIDEKFQKWFDSERWDSLLVVYY